MLSNLHLLLMLKFTEIFTFGLISVIHRLDLVMNGSRNEMDGYFWDEW